MERTDQTEGLEAVNIDPGVGLAATNLVLHKTSAVL